MKNLILPDTEDKIMWDLWMSTYHISIVTAADELNLFALLNNKQLNLLQIAEALQLNSRAIQILSEPLVCLGLLKKNNGKYGLTSASIAYFLPQSPFYWGAIFEQHRHRIEHKKIIEAITKGVNQINFEGKSLTDMWKEGSITQEAATQFTKKMHATIFAPSLGAVKTGLFKL